MVSKSPRIDKYDSSQNLALNGALDLFQRGSSITGLTSTSSTYLADKFLLTMVGTSATYRMDQSTDVPTYAESGYTFVNSLAIQPTTADASVGAGDLVVLRHFIQGYDYASIAKGKAFSVCFWVKSVLAGTYCFELRNDGNTRSYIKEYVLTANTWTKIRLDVSSDLSGTWLYDGNVGLSLCWTLMCGSTFQNATTGAWIDGNYRGTANQANLSSSTSNIFKITGVMVVEGTFDSSFDFPFKRAGKIFQSEQLFADRPCFRADKNGVNGSYTGAGVPQTVDWVIGSSYSYDNLNGFSANGYTLPVSGIWFFQAQILVNMAAGSNGSISIRNHNTGEIFSVQYFLNQKASADDFTLSVSALLSLSAGLKIGTGYANSSAGTYTIQGLKHYGYFQGMLVSRT